MKINIFTLVLVFFISTMGYGQNNRNITYDKDTIVNNIVIILNNLSGLDYAKIDENGNFEEFFIHDLADTTNYQYFKNAITKDDRVIQFKENHIYHFCNRQGGIAYHCILFLNNGNVKFFLALNCDLFDKIENVIAYIMPFFKREEFELIKERINNYAKYGEYRAFDFYEMMDACNNLMKRFNNVSNLVIKK